ncbi:hypothetical protein HU720_08370 [Pseudomonas sp. SWRI51]|uniref:hypothetical protein n=1 Tax=Pseudomonas sp. SWRI51 TaxID=2745491 RepID=UPI0016466423|nr:hypothetical protein [Pseudomonas sp. SWRI51]MBC3411317.1 hypothetical protein [Pseudomonas sp. SWRI51]
MEVEVVGGLSEDTVIWRYMGIDKFINLLADSGLFFTPLSFYKKSDPFEGYPPRVAMEALYSISKSFNDRARAQISYWEQFVPSQHDNPKFLESLQSMKDKVEAQPSLFMDIFAKTTGSTLVSCWCGSAGESEAMWKLYGESSKGIAIRSTVGRLKSALEAAQEISWPKKIFIGKVKYLDYADSTLSAKDCVVNGLISPLLKRVQYAHEHEIRAFFVSNISYEAIDSFDAKPHQIEISLGELIESVYVSPYVDTSYAKAVRAVFNVYQLQCDMVESELLKGDERLFPFIDR